MQAGLGAENGGVAGDRFGDRFDAEAGDGPLQGGEVDTGVDHVDQSCRGRFPDETQSLLRNMRDSGHLSLRHLEMLRRMLRIVSRQVNEIGDRRRSLA